VFVCKEKTDMRKSFHGLCGCVEQLIGADPLSGHMFAFFNKRSTMVKILLWDRTGFCIWYKRLEQGRFNIASYLSAEGVCIELPELMLILEGIDLSTAKRRKRFRLTAA
jgi:transposase